MPSTTRNKILSVALLIAFLASPLTTPITVDAQARPAAPAPTASITIGGAQTHTVTTGEGIPAVIWRSTSGATFKTHLMVNSAALCNGITDNQGWGQGGNTANGSTKLPDAGKAREGCVLTFVYTVTNRTGQKAVDRATLRYVAPKAVVSTPNPVVKPPITGGTGTGTTTPPVSSVKVKLLTPNGGERWVLNSPHTISWTPEPDSRDMVAYLEKKVGSQFQVVGQAVESGKGSIIWNGDVNQPGKYVEPGDGYYIRIVNTKNNTSDRSDSPFTLLSSDSMSVTFNLGDAENILKIDAAKFIDLAWTTVGEMDTCVLSIYNRNGQIESTENVSPAGGTKRIYVTLPNPVGSNLPNDGSYNAAIMNCDGPNGSRMDALEITKTDDPSTLPSIQVTRIGTGEVEPSSRIPFTYSGNNLAVPQNMYVYLEHEDRGEVPNSRDTIGDTRFTYVAPRTSYIGEWATFRGGRHRLVICDDNNENPATPGKPLCYHDAYFTITTPPEVVVRPIAEEVQIVPVPFGYLEKGVYALQFEITSQEEIYIHDSFKKNIDIGDQTTGFVYQTTSNGKIYSGKVTEFISDTDAERVNVEKAGYYYRIPAGVPKTFTVQVELTPDDNSSGHQWGIKLRGIQYRNGFTVDSKRTTLLLATAFPGVDFQTNMITIASALPMGTITPVAQGSAGDKVTLVQAALKKAGLFNEEITGYFGSITKAAIAAFQRENALDNIGAVGPKTAELLNQVLAQ